MGLCRSHRALEPIRAELTSNGSSRSRRALEPVRAELTSNGSSRSRPALEPIRTELTSNGSCRSRRALEPVRAELTSNGSSRSRPALEPIRTELISNGSCRDGRSTRDCPPPRRSRPQGLHYGCGAVYCGILILHVFSMAVQPLRLWGRRRASSVRLSSASSAQRLTGATVAPPSHPRDTLLPGVAGRASTVTPQGLSLRGSPPSSVLIPSTSTSSLSWPGSSCRHSPSCAGLAVRGYVDTVSFFDKGLELMVVASDFLNGGFALPGFFLIPGEFKPVRSRYGQIELPSICSCPTHQDRWSRQRQPPRGCCQRHTRCDKFHRQVAPGLHHAWCLKVKRGGGADLDASGQSSGSHPRNIFQERAASAE